MKNYLIVCVFLLIGCRAASTPDDYYYQGLIDEVFLSKLSALPDQPIDLYLSSNGGESNIGLESAKIISEKEVNIIIDGDFGICASGCAEFILPAAKSVTFINQPLIGYHQNPQIIYHILNKRASRDLEYCTFIKNEVDLTRELLQQKGLKTELWRETFSRIDLKTADLFYYDGKCPGLRREFHHELWFPTSQQLKSNLNLKFEGELCSDNPQCYESKIDKTLAAGTSLVIGDTIYVSKG